jgi:hypothetical protein
VAFVPGLCRSWAVDLPGGLMVPVWMVCLVCLTQFLMVWAQMTGCLVTPIQGFLARWCRVCWGVSRPFSVCWLWMRAMS